MSNDPRLYLDVPLGEGQGVPLSKDDSHYLINVMRRGEGDGVRLFNGRDGEWQAVVASAHKKSAVLECRTQNRPQMTVPDLWLLFAPVKRQKNELIVEKATELGVADIRPVVTARTQSERLRLDRFEAIAKEAAEQTERLDLPLIHEAARLDAVLDGWDDDRTLIYCDEAGDDGDRPWGGENGRGAPMLDVLREAADGPAAILIGPEGGFSTEERGRLRGLPFVRAVTLGPRILRAETAAIAALTLWQAGRGDWG